MTANCIGLNGELPSSERNQFYPADQTIYDRPKEQGGTLYWTTSYEPDYPDKSFVLNALSNLSPKKIGFQPTLFQLSNPGVPIDYPCLLSTRSDLAMILHKNWKHYVSHRFYHRTSFRTRHTRSKPEKKSHTRPIGGSVLGIAQTRYTSPNCQTNQQLDNQSRVAIA